MTDKSSELAQVQKYLAEDHGWENTKINFRHLRWVKNDLDNHHPKEVARMHVERCKSIASSVKAEFQAKYSAMTPQGAEAYADSWH